MGGGNQSEPSTLSRDGTFKLRSTELSSLSPYRGILSLSLPSEKWTNMKSGGRLSSRSRERSIGQPPNNNMPVLVRSRAARETDRVENRSSKLSTFLDILVGQFVV